MFIYTLLILFCKLYILRFSYLINFILVSLVSYQMFLPNLQRATTDAFLSSYVFAHLPWCKYMVLCTVSSSKSTICVIKFKLFFVISYTFAHNTQQAYSSVKYAFSSSLFLKTGKITTTFQYDCTFFPSTLHWKALR